MYEILNKFGTYFSGIDSETRMRELHPTIILISPVMNGTWRRPKTNSTNQRTVVGRLNEWVSSIDLISEKDKTEIRSRLLRISGKGRPWKQQVFRGDKYKVIVYGNKEGRSVGQYFLTIERTE